MSFICHIHNYTEYNESEMCSLHLTHPSTHTWSSGQPTVQRPGSSRGRIPQPWVTSGFKSNALSIRPRLPRPIRPRLNSAIAESWRDCETLTEQSRFRERAARISTTHISLSVSDCSRTRIFKLEIYRADIWHFFMYRHRPISVFSSADVKSGTSVGSPMLLVRWNVRCCM